MGKHNYIAVGALGLVLLVLPLVLPSSYYLGVAVFVGLHALIVLGLSLLMGYAGQISLGHAGFFAIGAYASGLLTTRAQWPPLLAVLAAILLAAGIALLIGTPSLRLRGHYLAMATLGFGQIVYVVATATVGLAGGPSGFGGIPKLGVGGWVIASPLARYYTTWVVVLGVLVFSLNLIHSRVGRALRSIHGSEVAANAMGVHTARYKIQVFVLSAMYAALAGSLYAHFVTYVSPSACDLNLSILLVTMVVVGGISSLWGALIGAILLGVLPEFLRTLKDYDILFYGLILLLILMFAPEGLWGLMKKIRQIKYRIAR